ncbi:MAG: hypothetical protein PHH13_01250 [Candidatus Peribacteraceae bacterium]|nr:hypothetical protein [Candidatus Peribacteraceae bacterium]
MVTAESGHPPAQETENKGTNGKSSLPAAPSIGSHRELREWISRLASGRFLIRRVQLMAKAPNGSCPAIDLEERLLDVSRAEERKGNPVGVELLSTFQSYWEIMHSNGDGGS